MNISENKRVVALSAVFAIAFGGLCYLGYDRMQSYSQSTKALTEINQRFEDYANAEVPPTKKNRDSLKAAYAQVNQVDKELQDELSRYAAYCYGDGKTLSAQDFQTELKTDVAGLQKLADEKGAKIGPLAADIGLSTFRTSAPPEAVVPYRTFQLRAANRVAQDVLNAGSPLLDKIYCAPLPEAAEAATKGGRKAVAHFPLSFEVAFEAKRGVLPQVINSIVQDKDFLLIITGLAIKGNESLPALEPYQAPEAAAAVGDDVGAAAEGKPAAAADAHQIAKRLTGDPNETVRVHLNLQVLYFNPAKNK